MGHEAGLSAGHGHEDNCLILILLPCFLFGWCFDTESVKFYVNVYRFCSECPILNCIEAFWGCIYFESVSIFFCDVFIHLESFLRRNLISIQEVVNIQLYTACVLFKDGGMGVKAKQ